MAGRGRGFTNERHAPLKAGVAAVAVAGFAVAWAGFAKSHEDVPGGSGDATAVATASPVGTKPAGATPATTETPRTGGPLPTLIAGGTVTAGGGAQPATTATATRSRRSRGS